MLVILTPFLVGVEVFRIQLPVGDVSCLAVEDISTSALWQPTAAADCQSVAAVGMPFLVAAEGISLPEKCVKKWLANICNVYNDRR
jgi:hypothetical protein